LTYFVRGGLETGPLKLLKGDLMNDVQIVCLIGIMAVCFVLGRYTKRWKIPIMGTLVFKDEGEPRLLFKCNSFEELETKNYIAIKVESRKNQRP
jgi:hypothetical protein